MFNLQVKMWLLVGLMFAIIYGVIVGIGNYFNIGDVWWNIGFAIIVTLIQYLAGPSIVSLMMRIKYVSETEEPELHQMISELAATAQIPKPKIGIAQISIPNAFAFGRTIRDGRVCITQNLKQLLTKDELKAVMGHEIAHLKHRDMMIMTLLSVVPLVLYWIAFRFMWGGSFRRGNYSLLIGLSAFALYFFTNLLVLYGSRIREYYADERSIKLGNNSEHLASALYKLVYSSAQAKRTLIGQEDLRRTGAIKAFFVNDIGRTSSEIRELKHIDHDFSGTIEADELLSLRNSQIKLSGAEKIMEIFTTHPNILKRIKRLALLT